jgi:Leucine-rich repeat (LRR) protein
LDVSKNTALEKLDCHGNSLKSLDVSNNTALTRLDCSGNSLKSLDVSNNKALKTLRCFGNQIRGAAMTNLVNSLPTRPDNDGEFIVYDYQNEGNIITLAQVKVAKDKGWAVKKLNSKGNAVDYAGDGAIFIDATNFPDPNFRKIVAAKDIDTNKDGILSAEEMDAVWMLDVENKGIADLTGVGNFPNLIALLCSGNTLTNLDISKNTKLVGLDCSNNRLTALNLSNNTVLSEVLCYGNDIKDEAMTNLINSLPQIEEGYLCVIEEGASSDNVITKGQVVIAKKKGWSVFKKDGSNVMDYEGAPVKPVAINEKNFPDPNFRIYLLNQSYGKDGVLTEDEMLAITELDVALRGIKDLTGIKYFSVLTELDCYYNSLKSLDISYNNALTSLNCGYNSLKSLDVSKNTLLTELDCYGNQISGEAMTKLVNSLRSLPSGTEGLFYVCNDKAEIDNIITPAQVNIATGKGWTVKKLGYNSIVMDYAGFGDVNGDGKIDQNDLEMIVKIIMGKNPADIGGYAGDLNNDGKTDAADIVVMVNILKSLGVK